LLACAQDLAECTTPIEWRLPAPVHTLRLCHALWTHGDGAAVPASLRIVAPGLRTLFVDVGGDLVSLFERQPWRALQNLYSYRQPLRWEFAARVLPQLTSLQRAHLVEAYNWTPDMVRTLLAAARHTLTELAVVRKMARQQRLPQARDRETAVAAAAEAELGFVDIAAEIDAKSKPAAGTAGESKRSGGGASVESKLAAMDLSSDGETAELLELPLLTSLTLQLADDAMLRGVRCPSLKQLTLDDSAVTDPSALVLAAPHLETVLLRARKPDALRLAAWPAFSASSSTGTSRGSAGASGSHPQLKPAAPLWPRLRRATLDSWQPLPLGAVGCLVANSPALRTLSLCRVSAAHLRELRAAAVADAATATARAGAASASARKSGGAAASTKPSSGLRALSLVVYVTAAEGSDELAAALADLLSALPSLARCRVSVGSKARAAELSKHAGLLAHLVSGSRVLRLKAEGKRFVVPSVRGTG
jgi:hypothetical protein